MVPDYRSIAMPKQKKHAKPKRNGPTSLYPLTVDEAVDRLLESSEPPARKDKKTKPKK